MNRMYRLALMPLVTVVLLGATPSSSWAQGQLDEITVTAQRRAESLQDAPIAITAFDEDAMREQGIETLQGISERTPGLLIGAFTPAQPEIAIRGVGTKEDGPGANDSTVISVDGVYVAARIAQVMDIADLQRIEVLRGPQGTLYGRNSIAGSINLITIKPDEEFVFRADQTIGSNNQFDTRLMVKGALSEDAGLYGKVSYSRRSRDGYVDLFSDATTRIGELEGVDQQSFRAQLRYAPNDQLEATFTIDAANDDDEGQSREPIGDITADPARNSVVINTALGGAGNLYNSFASGGFLEREVFGASLNVNYDFGALLFTSISAYRDADIEFALDCCGLNALVYPRANYDVGAEVAEQLTQEFRFSGQSDRLDWQTGLFYTDEQDKREENFVFGPVSNPDGPVSAIDGAFINGSVVDADIQAWALYGQGTYALTDASRLTIGLRYSSEEKTVVSSGFVTGGPPNGIITGPFGAVTANNDWDSTDFRLAFDHNLSDASLLYVSVASGFKSGGFTGAPKTVAVAVTPFDEENSLSYEIGLKSTLLENSLRLNVAAFYNDYEDLQVTRFALTPTTPTFGQFLTENAGAAEIKGLEIEATWLPTDNLELSFSWAFLDSEYTDFTGLTPDANGNPVDFSGNSLRQAPENSGSLNIRYSWGDFVVENGLLALNLSARYVDNVFYDPDNNPRGVVPSYTVADARLSFTSPSDRYGIDLWVNNIADEEYLTHAFSLTGGQRAFGHPGQPRWYGVTFSLNIK